MLRWEPQSIQGREDQGNSSSASCPQTLLLKAASVGVCVNPSPCSSLPTHAGENLQEATWSITTEPRHLSPFSQLVVTRAMGVTGQGRTKRPRPSFGRFDLMLLFPTRQVWVSRQLPSRIQAARTTRASSSVTTSQVSKANPQQRLPTSAGSSCPASCPFSGPSHPASPQ